MEKCEMCGHECLDSDSYCFRCGAPMAGIGRSINQVSKFVVVGLFVLALVKVFTHPRLLNRRTKGPHTEVSDQPRQK